MDKIVAAVNYRDYVLVFTEYGIVYKISHDDTGIGIVVQIVHQIDMRGS